MKKIHLIAMTITLCFLSILLLLQMQFVFAEDEVSTLNDEIIRIAFDPNLPPYQFYEQDEYKGFLLDLTKRIFDSMDKKIEFLPMTTQNALEAFDEGKVDMVLGLRFNVTLSERMSFTDSFVTSTISMVIPVDKEESIRESLGVEPYVIAVESGSTEFEFVKNIKKANFNNAFNQKDVVDLMRIGRADLMIGVRHVAEYILDSQGVSDQYYFSNTYVTPVDFYLAIDKDEVILLRKINTELRMLKLTGEYEDIYNLWINDKALENQIRIQKILTGMGVVLVMVIGGIFITSMISFQLKRKIDEKTIELSTTNQQLEKKIIEIKNTVELKNLIFESSPRSIVIFDFEGRVSDMNVPAQQICLLDSAPIGISINALHPINEMLKGKLEKILREGASYKDREFMVDTKGKIYYYRYVVYPLPEQRGGILTIEDITEEKLLKERVAEREKNKALIQIVSGIAHEIRNPLTSIKTYAELLPRKKDNEAFQKQISSVVPNEVDRVNALIENLIDYVKPKPKNVEKVNVEALIQSCILLFQPTVKGHQIVLETNLDKALEIDVDRNQLKQILINMILNAIDAVLEMRQISTNDEDLIRIDAYREGYEITIEISDNGIGMTRDELGSMFELFYTTKAKGSGIGMALSKQMIEENQGRIEVESEKYQGTTIRLKFGGEVHG